MPHDWQPSCSRATRRGGLRPILRSCRTRSWAGCPPPPSQSASPVPCRHCTVWTGTGAVSRNEIGAAMGAASTESPSYGRLTAERAEASILEGVFMTNTRRLRSVAPVPASGSIEVFESSTSSSATPCLGDLPRPFVPDDSRLVAPRVVC